MTKEQTNSWEEEFEKEFGEKIASANYYLPEGEADISMYDIKHSISKIISQEREKCIKEEVFAFMHHLQEKANTVSPNLLLNEVVNYAYDRINLLQNK